MRPTVARLKQKQEDFFINFLTTLIMNRATDAPADTHLFVQIGNNL